MANTDAAFGLRPYKMLGAGANTNGVMSYKIQTSGTAGTSSVIYEGTPVIPLAHGLIDIVGAAAGGTGSSTTGKSSAELDISTAATTNTLNMRIIGYEDSPSNADTSAAGMLAIVMLNNHFYRYNANGTGAGI